MGVGADGKFEARSLAVIDLGSSGEIVLELSDELRDQGTREIALPRTG